MRGLGWLVARELTFRTGDRRVEGVRTVLEFEGLMTEPRFCDGMCRGLRGEVEGAALGRVAVATGLGAERRALGM